MQRMHVNEKLMHSIEYVEHREGLNWLHYDKYNTIRLQSFEMLNLFCSYHPNTCNFYGIFEEAGNIRIHQTENQSLNDGDDKTNVPHKSEI